MEKILFLLMMLGAVQGFATDGGSVPVQQPAAKPSIVKSGEDYFLSFPDGRAARFYQMLAPVFRVQIKLRQIENTCDYGQILSSCAIETDHAHREIGLEWVKHPDAAKLGQVVKYKDSDGMEVLNDTRNLFWFGTLKNEPYASKFKRDRIVCDNFAWAKDIPVINARMNIDSWTGEFMVPNSETNVNENQSFGQVFDVVLTKVDAKTMEVTSFGPYKSFAGTPPYLSGQVSSLTFQDKNKKQCQVSFESTLEDAIRVISSAEAMKMDPTTKMPLRRGTVAFDTTLMFKLQSALGRTETPEFE